jgi:predicted lipid-binding transport protein (Tim44 family)
MGGFGHFFGALIGAVFGFFVFLVIVGLLFLLVRFLLAATKAAHIYIAKNSPATASRPAAHTGSAGPAYAPRPPTVAPTATTPAPVAPANPATKPRTTKPPTA